MIVYLACISSAYKSNTDLIINNKAPFLESFYSFVNFEIPLINHCDFLLDSGAFTFMRGNGGVPNWDDYIERYGNFVKTHNVKKYFELDIDSVVGYEAVKKYRKQLERITGTQCIPVWHKSRGIAEYKKMCDEYPYVAIGGIVTKEIKVKDYALFTPLIDIAHKKRCKIHGLGFTATKELSKYSFDSIDSTNWLYGRYGHYYIKEGGYMHLYRRSNGKRCIQEKLQRHNLSEWIKFQKYAEVNL